MNQQSLSIQDLQLQNQQLRLLIHEINQRINPMLSQCLIKNPEKQSQTNINNILQLLRTKTQLNNQILSMQDTQLQKIKSRIKGLEDYDHYEAYEEWIKEAKKKIWERKKETHYQEVHAHKLDGKLISNALKLASEEKQVTIMKRQLMVVFKKFHDNEAKLSSLAERMQQLSTKIKQQNAKLTNLHQYMPNKNQHKNEQELRELVQQQRRKKETIQVSIEKKKSLIYKEIKQIEGVLSIYDESIANVTEEYSAIEERTNQLMSNHRVEEKMLKNISYKFTKSRYTEASTIGNLSLPTNKSQKFRISRRTRNNQTINSTILQKQLII